MEEAVAVAVATVSVFSLGRISLQIRLEASSCLPSFDGAATDAEDGLLMISLGCWPGLGLKEVSPSLSLEMILESDGNAVESLDVQ